MRSTCILLVVLIGVLSCARENPNAGTEAGNAENIAVVGYALREGNSQRVSKVYYANTLECTPGTGCRDSSYTDSSGFFSLSLSQDGEWLVHIADDSLGVITQFMIPESSSALALKQGAQTLPEKMHLLDTLVMHPLAEITGKLSTLESGLFLVNSFVQPKLDSLTGLFTVSAVPQGDYSFSNLKGEVVTTVGVVPGKTVQMGVINSGTLTVDSIVGVALCEGEAEPEYYRPEFVWFTERIVTVHENAQCLDVSLGPDSKYGYEFSDAISLDTKFVWSLSFSFRATDLFYVKAYDALDEENVYIMAMDAEGDWRDTTLALVNSSVFDFSRLNKVLFGNGDRETQIEIKALKIVRE